MYICHIFSHASTEAPPRPLCGPPRPQAPLGTPEVLGAVGGRRGSGGEPQWAWHMGSGMGPAPAHGMAWARADASRNSQ